MSALTPEEAAADVEVRAVAAERLTFFSDAVIAIAITLLALELPVPEGATNAALLDSVGEHRDEYMAFLISFLVIGAHWAGHHYVFRYVVSLSRRLTSLSRYWLLMQVITPFATRVITSDDAFALKFSFYAVVQAIAGLLFVLMLREIRSAKLYREGTPADLFSSSIRRSTVMGTTFLLSIPVSFFTEYAYLCWIAIPLLLAVVNYVARRRAATGRQPAPADRP